MESRGGKVVVVVDCAVRGDCCTLYTVLDDFTFLAPWSLTYLHQFFQNLHSNTKHLSVFRLQ